MRSLFLTVLLLVTQLAYTQEEPVYPRESRFLLAGLLQPAKEVTFQELPLFYEGRYPFDFQRERSITLVYFLDSLSPFYHQNLQDFLDFCIRMDFQGLVIQSDGQGNAQDYHGHCQTLLGIEEYPSLYIFNQGRLVAYQQGESPEWENENLVLALEELSFYP